MRYEKDLHKIPHFQRLFDKLMRPEKTRLHQSHLLQFFLPHLTCGSCPRSMRKLDKCVTDKSFNRRRCGPTSPAPWIKAKNMHFSNSNRMLTTVIRVIMDYMRGAMNSANRATVLGKTYGSVWKCLHMQTSMPDEIDTNWRYQRIVCLAPCFCSRLSRKTLRKAHRRKVALDIRSSRQSHLARQNQRTRLMKMRMRRTIP